jgi:hypothetical protein
MMLLMITHVLGVASYVVVIQVVVFYEFQVKWVKNEEIVFDEIE